jgi:hypothetical protein
LHSSVLCEPVREVTVSYLSLAVRSSLLFVISSLLSALCSLLSALYSLLSAFCSQLSVNTKCFTGGCSGGQVYVMLFGLWFYYSTLRYATLCYVISFCVSLRCVMLCYHEAFYRWVLRQALLFLQDHVPFNRGFHVMLCDAVRGMSRCCVMQSVCCVMMSRCCVIMSWCCVMLPLLCDAVSVLCDAVQVLCDAADAV